MKRRTNVGLSYWRCFRPVCPTFHAITEGKIVVVLAEDSTAPLLNSTNGALRCTGGCDVNRRFQVLGTLRTCVKTLVHRQVGGQTYATQQLDSIVNLVDATTQEQFLRSDGLLW